MICLSFDTDHLDGLRMQEFLATVRIPGDGTFFCTHRYDCLTEPHELCPHPVLHEAHEWEAELSAKRAEFPEAVGWRSHSCIYSHLIAERVAASGYLYASTQYQPLAPARPFREPWGIWHMPVYYMDNMDFSGQGSGRPSTQSHSLQRSSTRLWRTMGLRVRLSPHSSAAQLDLSRRILRAP